MRKKALNNANKRKFRPKKKRLVGSKNRTEKPKVPAKVLISIIGTLGLIIVCILYFFRYDPGEEFQRIAIGMSMKEVHGLMGVPSEKGQNTWLWRLVEERTVLFSNRGRSPIKLMPEETIAASGKTYVVWFKDGKVVRKRRWGKLIGISKAMSLR